MSTNNEESVGIVIEALEVFLNQILYLRDVYPAQIFQKRRAYNTPIYVSIFPPLNVYLYKVLCSARELSRSGLLHYAELLLYRGEADVLECYKMDLVRDQATPDTNLPLSDEFLLHFEEQLRSSLYKMGQRMKILPKLPNDVKFKVLLHTTQTGFVQLSHNPHYQDFPWIYNTMDTGNETDHSGIISLLPLARLNTIGLEVTAEIFGAQ